MRAFSRSLFMLMSHPPVLWVCSELSHIVTKVFERISTFNFFPVLREHEFASHAGRVSTGIVVIHASSFGESKCWSLLETAQRVSPALPVIVYDPQGEIANPLELIKRGAFCILSGDLDPEKLSELFRTALAHASTEQLASLSENLGEPAWRKILIGESPQMRRVRELIELIAPRKSTVLVTGETGTGKEVVAKAIHMASQRARKPMVAVNCSAIPESLVEAEF